jgi:ribosomal protein S15P/S13E
MSKQKKSEKPLWLKYTQEEVKAIIIKLANKGLTAEKIGLVLRDQYGIPKISLLNLKMKKVLEEKEKYQEPNIINLKNQVNKIIEHTKRHNHDQVARRALIINKSQLKKREDYQKESEI